MKIDDDDNDPMQVEVESYLADVDMDFGSNDNVSHCRLHLRTPNA
jgi:hypothetical protein